MIIDELGRVVEKVLSPILSPKGYRYKAKNKKFGYSFEFSGIKAGRLQLISVDVFKYGGLSFSIEFYNESFFSPLALEDYFRLKGHTLLRREQYFSDLREFEDWLSVLVHYVDVFEKQIIDDGIAFLFFKSIDAFQEKGIDGFLHIFLPARDPNKWETVRAKEVQEYLDRFDGLKQPAAYDRKANNVELTTETLENEGSHESYYKTLEETFIRNMISQGYDLECQKIRTSSDYRLIKGNDNEHIMFELSIITYKEEANHLLTIYINEYNLWYLLLLLDIRITGLFLFSDDKELADWITLFQPYLQYFSELFLHADKIKLHREINWLLARQHYLEFGKMPSLCAMCSRSSIRAKDLEMLVVKDTSELNIRWRSEVNEQYQST